MEQDKYITKDRLKVAMDSLQSMEEKKQLLSKLKDGGYTIEGYNDQPKQKEPNLAQSLASGFIGGASNIANTAETYGRAGFKTLTGDKSFAQNVEEQRKAVEAEKQIGSQILFGEDAKTRDLSTAKGWERLGGDALSTAATVVPAGAPMKGATWTAKAAQGAKIGSTVGAMGGAGMSMQEGNDLATVGKDTLVGAGVGGAFGAAVPVAGAAINKGTQLTKRGAQKVFEMAKDSVGGVKYNHINSQVAESATRLSSTGVEPNKLYSVYSKAQESAAQDVKKSTALELMGNDIGDAFDNVIKNRQIVGKKVGDELKKVAEQKVGISDVSNSFSDEIKSALSKRQTKYSQSEIGMLTKFNYELKSLGKNATVDDVSNFITRMRSEIDVLKGSNGVLGTTNAERLITQATGELNKRVANSFPEYAAAKSEYSRLSDLLEEGIGYLGKKTADGNYKKETSVVKSSLNSILNGGKKDFLVQLEKETGKPLLDKAVIAAQVMKDLGDGRGESLLQKLTDETLQGKGYKQVAIDWAANKALGNKSKRTLRYLSDLPDVNISKIKANTNMATGIPTYHMNAANRIPPAISNIDEAIIPRNTKNTKAFENPLIQEAKKYKSAEEFVKAQGTPKTVQVWNKSKFSNDGAYADIPVIRKEENITLYQGGSDEGRQFWTTDKKYAEQFGKVTEKTGDFYKVDNGNRVTDVYIEAPTKSQLEQIWKEANIDEAVIPQLTEKVKEVVSKDPSKAVQVIKDILSSMPDMSTLNRNELIKELVNMLVGDNQQ